MTTPQRIRRRQRLIIALQGVTALAAVIALTLSLTSVEVRFNEIQAARERAAVASCELLRGLVLTATPASRRRQGLVFINRTPLRDCRAYGHQVRTGKI